MQTITDTTLDSQPSRGRPTWKLLALAAAGVAVVAGIVGLASQGGGSSPTETPTVAIDATDVGLDITGLSELEPGYTRFTDTNTTDSDHALIIAKLHAGVTPDDMLAALQSPDGIEALGKADFYGGVDDIPHHTTWAETVELGSGTYVLVDHAEGRGEGNGAWFTEPGFFVPFTIADGESTTAAAPTPDAVITMRDFVYDMPAKLPADGVVELRNEGTQLHMSVLLKLNPGVTAEEAIENLSPDTTLGTPLEFLGVTSPGVTVSVEQHFEPGTYVMACLMPDMARDGVPHAMEGMVTSFTVD